MRLGIPYAVLRCSLVMFFHFASSSRSPSFSRMGPTCHLGGAGSHLRERRLCRGVPGIAAYLVCFFECIVWPTDSQKRMKRNKVSNTVCCDKSWLDPQMCRSFWLQSLELHQLAKRITQLRAVLCQEFDAYVLCPISPTQCSHCADEGFEHALVRKLSPFFYRVPTAT